MVMILPMTFRKASRSGLTLILFYTIESTLFQCRVNDELAAAFALSSFLNSVMVYRDGAGVVSYFVKSDSMFCC